MTVDELLQRVTAQELAEWEYLLGKETEIHKAVRAGVDAEVATHIAFESKDEE